MTTPPVHPPPAWVAVSDDESDDSHVGKVRSLRRAAMLTAAVGAAHAVLFIASFLLMTSVPDADASTASIIDFYTSEQRRRVVIVGMYAMPFAGIAFIWFIVALRTWVEGATKQVGALVSNIQLVSGIVYVTLLFASAASTTVLATSVEFADGEIDPVVAHQFPSFGSALMLVFALRMASMFVLSTSTIGRSSGALPKWFAYTGYVVGLFLLLTASLQFWFALVFPAWLIVLSVLLMLRAREVSRDVMISRRPGSVLIVQAPGA